MAQRPARTRPALLLARILWRLLILAVLLAGIPAVLLAVGSLPSRVPALDEAGRALMAPDDGSLLFTTLTVAAWIAWLWLLVPLLVESGAVIARRATPRLPGMATSQRLAAFLLGGLFLTVPAGVATAATVTPAVAVSSYDAPSPADTARPAAQVQQTPAGAVEHRVGGEDVLAYDVAEERLGDGLRWRDLARLNPGLDVTGPSSELPAGTVVNLPADALPAPAAERRGDGPAAQSATAERERVVQPADTLSEIAQDEYGDPALYPRLFEANEGKQQPHGERFTDPDLIYPGQKLTVPDLNGDADPDRPTQEEPAEEEPAEEEPSQASPPRTDPDAAAPDQTPEASPEQSAPPASQAPASPDDAASPEGDAEAPTTEPQTPSAHPDHGADSGTAPSPSASAPQQPQPHTSAPTSPAAAQDDDSNSTVAAVLAIAGAGFLAAAVVAMLAKRRTLQHRRRGHGRKIAMPSGRPAVTEQTLRSVDAGVELGLLDAALRTLAVNLADQERALPQLAAVQVGSGGIRLHLAPARDGAEGPAASAPFTVAADNQWWCPAGTRDLADEAMLSEVDPPYPALVQLGQDDDGGMVLIDLERYGALQLVGVDRVQALHMLALSLALTPMGGQLEVAVAGEETAVGLAVLDNERVTPYPGLAEAVQAVRRHHTDQQHALTAGGSDEIGQARPDEDFGELWPLVVLADLDTCPTADAWDDLAELLAQSPRSATAVITSSSHTDPGPAAGVWRIDTTSPSVNVPGTSLECTVALCPDEVYSDILDQVLTADSLTDLPRPAHDPDTAVPSPRSEVLVEQAAPEPESPAGPPSAGHPSAVGEPAESKLGQLLANLADLDDEPHPADGPGDTSQEETSEELQDPSAAAGTSAPGAEMVLPVASDTPGRTTLPAVQGPARVTARIPDYRHSPAPDPSPTPSGAPAQDAVESPRKGGTARVELPEGQPTVRILGPVDLVGARGHLTSNRATMALELATWLALNPGSDRHGIDGVIAPAGQVTRDTRNSRISDVRRWLGRNDNDDHYFPQISTQPDKRYRLTGVECDWNHFQTLHAAALHAPDDEVTDLLRQALTLVRGRPFAQIPPRRYSWAEPLANDIIELVTDAAEDLAERCLERGDARGALWAAGRGLDVAREREELWRMKIRALDLLGDSTDLETALQQLDQLLVDLHVPMEDQTADVIRTLQTHSRR